MKIAIGQINATIGDFEANRLRMLEFSQRALEDHADLLVFPELSLCGYPPNDLLDHDAFATESLKALRRFQHDSPSGIAIVVGYVDRNRELTGKPLVNAIAVIRDGALIFTQEKTLLPTYDVFDETRYFEPAKKRDVFELAGKRIGIAICEDIWWETVSDVGTRYPVDPVADLLDSGAELIIAPSASPFYSGKVETRRRLLAQIGRSSGVPCVYVNMVGGNDSLIFDGQSLVTDATGRLVHRSPGFSESYDLIDLEAPGISLIPEIDRYSEIRQALVLGIRDYLRKTGFDRVHLALSGGIDSALVAVLATEAVGVDSIVAFGMPSRYSSEGSVTDARLLCENLGIPYRTLPIEAPFTAFLDTLSDEFEGTSEDIAEENLQARIRGSLLMTWSNKFESLVLSTGNKSELATGYCTLYGDMCGALGVIGDLFKTEVYELCRHINRDKKIIPESILTKAPSAELRPDQKDEDSLPPYDLLDQVLHLYLLENKTGPEIVDDGFAPELVARVLALVGRAEYKRRQAAPVIKVSPRAFGTGRRMPIARRIYEA